MESKKFVDETFDTISILIDKKSNNLIIIVILIIIFIIIFISLLDLNCVILLNQLITNGKDPQLFYNGPKSSSLSLPSTDGLKLPYIKPCQWFQYIISPAKILNSFNINPRILKDRKTTQINKFTYSIWLKIFNVEENYDWKSDYSIPKVLLNCGYSPILLYIPKTNIFRIGMTTNNSNEITFYDIKNLFHIQTWQHLVIVLENKNLDVYLNGLLKVSYILPSIPYFALNSHIQLFSNYGFYAQVCLITYYSKSLNIKEVETLYNQNKDDKVPYKKNFKKILS